MKRQNNLYYPNLKYQIIEQEYLQVKKNCRHGRKLINFSTFLNSNIYEILEKLYNRNYEFDRYYVFLLKEYKYRIIMSETIKDKIVNHWVASNILIPTLEPSLVDSNVATRKGMGSSKAYELFESYLRKIGFNKKIYVLKLDMSKYFYSIDHNVLKQMIRKKIKDIYALDLIDKIIDETDDDYINERIAYLKKTEIAYIKSKKITDKEKEKAITELKKIPFYEKGRGLAIGNICSQILAVFFLNEIDHFFKNDMQCKYFIRYMDDIVVLDSDKNKLSNLLNLIGDKICDYNLKLNAKSNIFFLNNGFTFLGYTYKINNNSLFKRPRNITYHKIVKKLKYYRKKDYNYYYRSRASYMGYLKFGYYNLNEEFNYLSECNLVFLYTKHRYYFNSKYELLIRNYIKSKYIENNSISSYIFKKLRKKLDVQYIILKESTFNIYN